MAQAARLVGPGTDQLRRHPSLPAVRVVFTGDYTHGDFVEAIFDEGVGSCIASTQLSPMSVNAVCGVDLYGGAITTASVGQLFTDLKRSYWTKAQGTASGRPSTTSTVTPNMGQPEHAGSRGRGHADPAAAATLDVQLPAYTVAEVDGLDHVRIPRRGLAGIRRLRDPVLSDDRFDPGRYRGAGCAAGGTGGSRGGRRLQLPVNVADKSCCAEPRLGIAAEGNLPFAGIDYDWKVVDQGDGSAMLVITLYPFRYNP